MIESLTPQLAEYFGVKRGEGVLVRGVERGSAAAKAGLKAGDVIVSIDKEQISDVSDWRRVMRAKSGKVSVGIIREKRQQSVPMTVPERKSREQGAIVLPEIELGDLDIDFDAGQFRKEFELIKPKIEEQRRLIAMQLEKQRPQIEKAIREAQQINRIELDKVRKEILKIDKEKIKREVENGFDKAKFQKDMEKMKSELAKIDTEKIKREALAGIDQQELEKMQQEIQKHMEELRENLRQHQKQFQMISY
jgi:membrane-associated protease RseP (regulator of RpoE activity)